MSEIQGKPVYGTCECKEKVQVLSVDQVTDLIQQMASNDWQVPADYIPKTSVNGVIEQHNKNEIKFWRGTTAEYDALTVEEKATYTPILTDDAKYQEIENILNSHGQSIENINSNITKMLSGDLVVGDAKKVNNLEITKDENGVLKIGDIVIPQRKNLLFDLGDVPVAYLVRNTSNEIVNNGISLNEKLVSRDKVEVQGCFMTPLTSEQIISYPYKFEFVIPDTYYSEGTMYQMYTNMYVMGEHYDIEVYFYIPDKKLMFGEISQRMISGNIQQAGYNMYVNSITKIIE